MPGLSEFSAGFGLDEYTTKSGKRKAKAEEQALDIGALQQEIAANLYDTTEPVRGSVLGGLTGFASGSDWLPPSVAPRAPDLAGLDTFLQTGTLPTAVQPGALPAVPAYPQVPTGPSVPDLTTASRGVLESQFQQARGNLVATTPVRGGTLGAAMTQLEGQRALGVATLYDRQKQLQYDQDLARTRQQHTEDLGRTQLQHSEDLQEAQRRNTQAQSLYGVGLDLNREQANIENQTRRALYASAVGTAFGQPQSALAGLSGASTTFGNVASLALNESLEKQKRAQDKAGTLGGLAGGGGGSKGGGGGGASGGGYGF
jgi:hypothetical protein